MACLGEAQRGPTALESQAAQLYVVSWFREDFLRRYPTGIVLSELEYMGRTTSPSGSPTPLRTFGRPGLNRVLDALAHDFRRWSRPGDYRKCDVLGIGLDGRYAELLEVTTEGNQASAVTQLASKLAILRETVNRIYNMSVDWLPATWRPASHQLFRSLPSPPNEITYLCYMPTFRVAAPPGIVLYEIHTLQRERATVPVPVPAPQGAGDRLRQAVPANQESVEARARRFLADHPDVANWIKAIALVLSVAAAIVAIIALIDPVPGDELAAAALASALFRLATAR